MRTGELFANHNLSKSEVGSETQDKVLSDSQAVSLPLDRKFLLFLESGQ